MELPNLFSTGSGGAKSEMVICIVLTDSSIQAVLLKINPSTTRVDASSRVLSYSDVSSLIMQADEALQDLGPESESVNKIIYALDHSWMERGQVTEEYAEYISKITTGLSLQPVGFVVQSEAILQHKFEENPHFSGVLCIITRESISVSVMNKGTSLGTELIGRSDEIASDVIEGLARFHQSAADDALPNTIVLGSVVLAEEELVTAQQDILNQNWTQFEYFSQVPHVELLRPQDILTYIGHQAGAALLMLQSQSKDGNPVLVESEIPEFHEVEDEHQESTSADDDKKNPDTNKKDDDFVTPEEELAIDSEHQNVSAASFGIPMNPSKEDIDEVPKTAEPEVGVKEVVAPKVGQESLRNLPGSLGGVKKRKMVVTKKKMVIFGFLGFLAGLLTLAIGVYFWLLLGSSLLIKVEPETELISKTLEITLTSKGETNPEEKVLRAEVFTVEKSGEQTTDASGVKIVGEKATGVVTIYNKTVAEKIFPAGVVVSAEDGTSFTTDEEMTIPAAEVKSNTSGEQKKYGSADVKVTAVIIGSESNLPKDTELSVADFGKDTYVATSKEEFAGGSSREVRVVSKTDQDVLASELKKELTSQAEEDIKAQSGNGRYFVPDYSVVVESAKYDREIEDEAESVSLQMTVSVSTLEYHAEDIKPIVEFALQEEVPEGYEFSKSDPQIMSAPVTSEDSQTVSLEADVVAQAVAIVDQKQLLSEIFGKNLAEAKSILEGKESIKSASIIFSPSWASSVVRSIPKNESRVTLELKANEE